MNKNSQQSNSRKKSILKYLRHHTITIHHSDGLRLLDLSALLGTVFMILGSIYGFILTWGPVIWALIGLLFWFWSWFNYKASTNREIF